MVSTFNVDGDLGHASHGVRMYVHVVVKEEIIYNMLPLVLYMGLSTHIYLSMSKPIGDTPCDQPIYVNTDRYLTRDGVTRVVVGHKPVGELPGVVRSQGTHSDLHPQFEHVSAHCLWVEQETSSHDRSAISLTIYTFCRSENFFS